MQEGSSSTVYPTKVVPFLIHDSISEEECCMFDYDSAALLDLEVLSEHLQGNIPIQDITYASPKGGKVTAYLIIPSGSGPFAG
jgi:hypothetical protein